MASFSSIDIELLIEQIKSELENSMNYYDADTDEDGWNDDKELFITGTDPLSVDSDGIEDVSEYVWWCYYYGQAEAAVYEKLLIADVDGDDVADGVEKNLRTNPLDSDTDNDGLTDGEELYDCSTDPTDIDSDNDQLTDSAEVNTYGSDPLDSDSDDDSWMGYFEVKTSGTSPIKADTDNDGIKDKAEYSWWVTSYRRTAAQAYAIIKTHDVDGDGLKDSTVKSLGTNLLDNDSDNDGLTNGLEVNTYGTDPLDSDTDGDGYSDLYEICNDSDPTDASSTPGSGGSGIKPWEKKEQASLTFFYGWTKKKTRNKRRRKKEYHIKWKD